MFEPTWIAPLMLVLTPAVVDPDAPQPGPLDGLWIPRSATLAGQPFPEEIRKAIRLEIKGDLYTVTVGDQADKGTCKLDSKADPKTIDITGSEGPNQGKTIPAIYKREGNLLTVCYDLSGEQRPKAFASEAGSQHFLVEYELQKP